MHEVKLAEYLRRRNSMKLSPRKERQAPWERAAFALAVERGRTRSGRQRPSKRHRLHASELDRCAQTNCLCDRVGSWSAAEGERSKVEGRREVAG